MVPHAVVPTNVEMVPHAVIPTNVEMVPHAVVSTSVEMVPHAVVPTNVEMVPHAVVPINVEMVPSSSSSAVDQPYLDPQSTCCHELGGAAQVFRRSPQLVSGWLTLRP